MLKSIEKMLSKVMGGTSTEREVKRLEPLVGTVNEYAKEYEHLSDDELKAKTNEFKYRLRMGETLDDILPEAFAVVKDTCRRLRGKKWIVRGQEIEWDMIPYDVQILGGMILHSGKIAEMATGEGKTLVASMPLYLNALEGKGVHLITVNDYLAQRDCEWMGEIYKFLGLTVAAIFGDQSPEERRAAYHADITYGTNNEFGFDYLRDNMAQDVWSVVQRPLHYAIVDEVDSVLIDEARTPLIISGAVGAPKNIYKELKPTVENLAKRQNELVQQLLREGKELLENEEEQAGIKILQVHRGDPKNKELLELLTSEFWVKKLIERIQGQYEVNKQMGEIDADLYFTIDEKSHVIDITEKGRIFLSGGRDQDIVHKIQKLDELSATLEKLSEQKNRSIYFTHDSITGTCNGLTLAGKAALIGIQSGVAESEFEPIEQLALQLNDLPEEVNTRLQNNKGDKASAWRQFYDMTKKMDRAVNSMAPAGIDYLKSNANGKYDESIVDAFVKLLDMVREEADVDAEPVMKRPLVDRRRELTDVFFETEKQFGAITGLTEEGKLAVLAMQKSGDPMLLPTVNGLIALLNPATTQDVTTIENIKQEYFEFKDNGAVLNQITEKGRIALLGGNPDLYVLPDRTLVEERDQQIQKQLDDTLNQADYDYSAHVLAVEDMDKDVTSLYEHIQTLEDPANNDFYVMETSRFDITALGVECLSNFSSESKAVIRHFEKNLGDYKDKPEAIFKTDADGRVSGLADAELERLMGASFADVDKEIKSWSRDTGKNELSNKLKLDAHLQEKFNLPAEIISASRRFEEVERLNNTIQMIFTNLADTDQTLTERQRWLRRYFQFSGTLHPEDPVLTTVNISGLTENGRKNLQGLFFERSQVVDKLKEAASDPNVDIDALFVLDENKMPKGIEKAARTLLIGGLPYFNYRDEYQSFRDEIMQLSTKKAGSRAELQGLLPKEKAHLRSRHVVLDDREMTELLSNAHMPNFVMRNEEIEHWFRIHFERRPRVMLEQQRDKIWQDYNRVEERVQNISQLLRAYTLYHNDVEYVVKAVEDNELRRTGAKRGNKAVMIVDQFTGRLMPGRRFSDGLHEALEAKEGVEVQAESQTLATITLQNFFRLYNKLAGMTGTAETEAQEFYSTYKLDVIVAPTNRPVIRDDMNDVIYRTKAEKYDAIIKDTIEYHEKGLPVLIGTVSVDVSQHLSNLFTQRGIPVANWLKKGDVTKELESGRFHTVLNAKYHKNEAEIVAKAGLPGSITIATNMAGRGTDIKLTRDVIEKGGLQIIGSEKHEARRIDRQLRGRAGRQGDPGSSRFYLSLEDDLMRLFGSDRITNIMSRLGSMDEGERIEHSMITKSIERAQKKVEERNFEIRKHLLDYDDVLNEQRKIIYKRRQNLLGFAQPEDFVEAKIKRFIDEEDDRSTWKLDELFENLKRYFGAEPDFTKSELESQDVSGVRETLRTWVDEKLKEQRHLYQMQERHRITGYCNIQDIIDELVLLKIRLHNAGTRDISKWNIEGIGYEMERIFEQKPDWLENSNIDTADAFESKLKEWAASVYNSQVENGQKAIDLILFKTIPLNTFLEIYVNGLVNRHLPIDAPAATWNSENFLSDLEKIFMQRPPIGENEMRTIRREKVIEKVQEWLDGLAITAKDEMLYRNRILGYFSSVQYINAIVEHSFIQASAYHSRDVLELEGKQAEFLQGVFGKAFEPAEALKDWPDLVNQTMRWARNTYLEHLRENISVYNQLLLANTSIEELIESSIIARFENVIKENKDAESTQQLLASSFQNMFMGKPDKILPASRERETLNSYREELVAWGLSFYKTYADRVERYHQERLSTDIVFDSVLTMIDDTIYQMISGVLGNNDDLDATQIRRLESECRLVFRQSPRLHDESGEAMDPNTVMNILSSWAQSIYRRRVDEIGESMVARYERYYILEKIDENWRQHLSGVDELREGIGLRGYGQKDPLIEYKSEAYKMFVKMIDSTNRDIVSTLFRVLDVGGELEEREMRRAEPQKVSTSHSQVELFKQVMAPPKGKAQAQPTPGRPAGKQRQVINTNKVGRNEPCPCGSGKKYKNCCGKGN